MIKLSVFSGKYIFFVCLLFLSFPVLSQRISFGVNFDGVALNYIRFSEDIVFSNRTYRAYYINKSNINFSPAMATSFGGNIDYSRFSLFFDMGIFTDPNGPVIQLNYPVAGDDYNIYYSRVKNGGYRINNVLYYKLSSPKAYKPCLGFGISRIWPIQNIEDFSTYKDFSKAWYDEYELKPNYKMDKTYNNYVLAFGYKGSDMAFIIKYNFRWNKNVQNDNYYSYLMFALYTYANFSNLRKNTLYFD